MPAPKGTNRTIKLANGFVLYGHQNYARFRAHRTGMTTWEEEHPEVERGLQEFSEQDDKRLEYVTECLLGWDKVTDREGNEVEFAPEQIEECLGPGDILYTYVALNAPQREEAIDGNPTVSRG